MVTLDEASTAVGISRSHLNLIELGKATGVSRETAAKIDAGLGCEGTLLALLPTSAAVEPARGEEMRRAEFNKAAVAFAASLLLDPDRLFGTQTVDEALLQDLESLTAELARRQHFARPQVLRGPLQAHLRALLDLEGSSMLPSRRLRLAHVTAETAALAGWVAFRGYGDLVTAHAQLALARQRARDAGDDSLTAQLLAISSSLYSSLDIPRPGKDPRSPLALSLLHAAQRKAATGPPALQGWIAARVAGEQALFGEARKVRSALARAEATLPSGGPEDPARLFIIWNEERFPGWAGKTLLSLGDPAATELLERALASTTAPHPRLGLQVDVALARLRQRDGDQAVALLVKGAEFAVEHGIEGYARWRLREARAALPAAQRHAFTGSLHELA